jgi:hypothetical protein
MKKHVSILLVLCVVYSLQAQTEFAQQNNSDSACCETGDVEKLEERCEDGLSLLRRPSYGRTQTSGSALAQPLWFESTEDTATVSREEEEVQTKPGFNWKGCCIAGGCAAGLIVYIFLASMAEWLTTR